MPDFLEHLETIRAEEASPARLFDDAGSTVRTGRRNNPRYRQSLAEAATLVNRAYQGNRRALMDMQEAMSTSDFPLLFGDILDRQLLAAYAEWPVSYPAFARTSTVRDFRVAKRYAINGGGATLEPVKELTEYPAASLADTGYSLQVSKFGRRLPFSWEAFINDDLDALKQAPETLGRAARRSEEKFAAGMFVSPTGPNAGFFSLANKNLATGPGSALSISALQAAYTAIMSQVDVDGNPIYIEAVQLIVPPSLKIVANNIINATEILAATGGGAGIGAADQLRSTNWMRSAVDILVNPWLPIVNTTNGLTAWYLVASPSAGRPALEIAHLRGHETPETFMKSPNATRVGGGTVDPYDGDYDVDAIEYKVRHVYGGTLLDPKSSYAATGV